MAIVKFNLGDTLILKKKHPCSCDAFNVLRLGSDIRIVCRLCGRDLTLPRETLEKSIKKVISSVDGDEKDGQ